MKFKFLLVLLSANLLQAKAQVHLQGFVIDMQTGKPVAGATVGFLPLQLFYPCNRQGGFIINDARLKDTDTLFVSCIGYQTQKVLAKSINGPLVVNLSPHTTLLAEVSIATAHAIHVGSKLKTGKVSVDSHLPGTEQALLMNGSKNVTGIIKSVSFFISKGEQNIGDAQAPFGIKLYRADAEGRPGKALINDIIIASAKNNNEWFEVDLLKYHIKNPENGFFVAFVILEENAYQKSGQYANPDLNIITPGLACGDGELKTSRQYFGVPVGTGLEWHRQQMGCTYLIRATIIPE